MSLTLQAPIEITVSGVADRWYRVKRMCLKRSLESFRAGRITDNSSGVVPDSRIDGEIQKRHEGGAAW